MQLAWKRWPQPSRRVASPGPVPPSHAGGRVHESRRARARDSLPDRALISSEAGVGSGVRAAQTERRGRSWSRRRAYRSRRSRRCTHPRRACPGAHMDTDPEGVSRRAGGHHLLDSGRSIPSTRALVLRRRRRAQLRQLGGGGEPGGRLHPSRLAARNQPRPVHPLDEDRVERGRVRGGQRGAVQERRARVRGAQPERGEPPAGVVVDAARGDREAGRQQSQVAHSHLSRHGARRREPQSKRQAAGLGSSPRLGVPHSRAATRGHRPAPTAPGRWRGCRAPARRPRPAASAARAQRAAPTPTRRRPAGRTRSSRVSSTMAPSHLGWLPSDTRARSPMPPRARWTPPCLREALRARRQISRPGTRHAGTAP